MADSPATITATPVSSSSFARATALTNGTFHLDLHDVVADDETAIAIFTCHAQRNGKILDNPTCLRMRLRDIKVIEFWEFVWDLEHVEEFWY